MFTFRLTRDRLFLSIGHSVYSQDGQMSTIFVSASFVTNELVSCRLDPLITCPHFHRPWTIDQGVHEWFWADVDCRLITFSPL